MTRVAEKMSLMIENSRGENDLGEKVFYYRFTHTGF